MCYSTQQQDDASGVLTNSLHGVSLLDEKLGSGDVDMHAERLLLFVNWLSWTCVFAEEHKTRRGLHHHAITL